MSTFTARMGLTVATLLLSVGCAKYDTNSEVAWARAALERNPNFELIATDEQNGTFTLRDRQTGEVQAVKLRDLGAAPMSAFAAQASALANAAPPTKVQAPEPAPSPPAATAAVEPAPATAAPAEEVVRPEPETLAAGTPVDATAPTKPYTIERNDGQLKISGPGISVVSAGPRSATAGEAQSSRPAEPIICEGRRMLHLDNRNIYVDGDAITVRGGCELYLTNSNIVASGTGIVVQDGTVHISNSYIEGAGGSFEADSQAKVFVRGSTFQGMSRRDQLATVQDQGGNRWR